MKREKKRMGKVLVIVVSAVMIAAAIPATIARNGIHFSFDNNDNNDSNGIFNMNKVRDEGKPHPPIPPVGDVAPDAKPIFYENFSNGFGVFTEYSLSGDGKFVYNATGECIDYDPGYAATYLYGVENDYLNATFTIDVDCYDTVILQFDYWGRGLQSFQVYIDNQLVGTFIAPGTHTTANEDITSYIIPGTTQTLAFHVAGAPDKRFSIDNVIISVNYTTDIIINGIEGMEDGGRYNTFPKMINVSVTNRGTKPIDKADFHLQIYKEVPFEPENYKCWNLESCFLTTWDTWSADGDQARWYWTEKRSHSPTHSYACKPDYLDTYEANSEDYLILHDWFTIPTEHKNKTVHAAFLNFSYWCKGEYTGYTVTDYGYVFIETPTNPYPNLIPVGGPYYETDGKWMYEEINLSAYIGQDIKIWFGWFSDDYLNYEGMYVDDICIQLGYTSDQPLVFQGYKYADFGPNETKTISFPVEFTPDEGTYFIQIYTDYEDCLPGIEGGNEINWTIWFGDVCDAAILNITAPAELEMPDEGYVNVPINVTVYNNGTLTKDVPVEVKVQHKLVDTIFEDDVESGDKGWYQWYIGGTGNPDFSWVITEKECYSATHAWAAWSDIVKQHPAGLDNGIATPEPITFDEGTDVVAMINYNFGADNVAFPVLATEGGIFMLGEYIGGGGYPYDIDAAPFKGSSGGWQLFSFNEYIRTHTLYWEKNDYWGGFGEVNNLAELVEYLSERYGVHEFRPGFHITTTTDGAEPTFSGFLFDDFKVIKEYTGATVWNYTIVAENLAPEEERILNFTWNATEYCDYVITAQVKLECDIDPSNDKKDTQTRIYEQMYIDENTWSQEDNTAWQPDDWHIVEECSICPTNHFWWNGREELNGYANERNDSLYINETFDWSTASQVWINFSTRYNIEENWDHGYVEVSNDSGITWYIMYDITGNSTGWEDISVSVPWTFFTDQMHVRFRFVSDEFEGWKGWYIDNVSIEVDGKDVFHDDMEDVAASADLWYHMVTPAGCHWHVEDLFGNGNTSNWFWNGENRTWHSRYGKYYPNVDEKLIFEFDLMHAYEAILTWRHNYSFADEDDQGWVEISIDEGNTWIPLRIYKGNSGNAWENEEIDITKYAGGNKSVLIRYRFISNENVEDYGWLIDNVSIEGKVDYTPPTITAILDPSSPDGNYGWYKSPVTVTLIAEDNVEVASIYYRIDNGSWKLYTAPFTIDVDGEHIVEYYAVDEVGNPSDIGSISFKIDHTAPAVSILYPHKGYIYLLGKELFKNPLGRTIIIGGITFEASASDITSGVDYVTFAINGMTYEKASEPYEIWWHKFNLLPAKYTLTVSAYDVAGNKATDTSMEFTHWL